MKQITKVGAENFKVEAFEHELSPVTLFIGENWSGKSARLDAVRACLLGHLPELGEKNAATFQLSRGTKMRVRCEFNDKTVADRTWLRSKSSVKQTVEQPDWMEKIPPVLLNTSVYLEMSGPEQIRFVFGLSRTQQGGEHLIEKLRSEKLKETNKRREEIRAKIVEEIDAHDTQRHEEGRAFNEWLGDELERMRAEMNKTNASIDRQVKFTEAVVSKENESAEPLPRSVKTELDAKRARVRELVGEVKSFGVRENSRIVWEHERDALNSPTLLRNEEEAKAKLTKLCSELEEAKPKAEFNESLRSGLVHQESAEQHECGKSTSRLTIAKHNLKVLEQEMEKSLNHSECPVCHTKGQSFVDGVTGYYKDKINLAKLEIDHATVELEAVMKKIVGLQAQLTEQNEKRTQAMAWQATVRKLENEIGLLRSSLTGMESDRVKFAGRPVPDVVDADAKVKAGVELNRLDSEVNALEIEEKRYAAMQADNLRKLEAKEQVETLLDKHAVEKAIVGWIGEFQEKQVKDAFTELLATANKFTDGILKSPLAYHEGELGRMEEGRWISHEAFSGMEKAIAYVGLSVALAQESPIKIVFIDEMGRLTWKNKQKLVVRMVELVEQGVIDQALLVDVLDPTAENFCKASQFSLVLVK